MKDCKEIQKLLPDYLQGNLDHRSIRPIQSHIQTCNLCQAEFETTSNIWEKMNSFPEEKPGENMKNNFYAMLAAYKEGLHLIESRKIAGFLFSLWLQKSRVWKVSFQFGFAVLFLILGLVLGRTIFSSHQTDREIVLLKEELKKVNRLVTLSLLHQKSSSERLKGVSWTYQMSKPDSEVIRALVQTLNHDPNVNVRLAAVDALSIFMDEPDVKTELIQSLLEQTYPLVQIELIDVLVKRKVKKSIDVFQNLIQTQDVHQNVREHAQWGIRQLG